VVLRKNARHCEPREKRLNNRRGRHFCLRRSGKKDA
jgi:hypothetical protein